MYISISEITLTGPLPADTTKNRNKFHLLELDVNGRRTGELLDETSSL